MGTPRVLTRYDVHCLECGHSDEVRSEPTHCPLKRCRSENIVFEDNRKYVLQDFFSLQDGEKQYYTPEEHRGIASHTLHMPGYDL